MSVATLQRASQQFLHGDMGFSPYAVYKKDNGVLVVERQPVFRSGTFRDSFGEQATYEPVHIKQMLDNFTYLRSKSIFTEVPVRDGHPGWIVHDLPGNGRVVGWHSGVAVETMKSPVDGNEYDYLLADYYFTEPDAKDKYERGTWKNRSSEILRYVTNAEAEFWPVYGGFAFVDIPAVEGLNFNRDTGGAQPGVSGERVRYFVMPDREINVTSPAPGTPAPSQPAQPSAPAPSQPAQPTVPAPTPTPTPSQPAPASPSSGQHAAASYVFTVSGQATNDFAAVQRHITILETAANEARNTARAAFVLQLVTAQRILGDEANVKMQTEFAQSLTDAQFVQWSSGFGTLPQPSVLGQHGASVAGTAVPTNGSATQATEQIEIDKGVVAMHRNRGASLEQLKAMPSYQRLVAAGVEK